MQITINQIAISEFKLQTVIKCRYAHGETVKYHSDGDGKTNHHSGGDGA